MLLCNLSACKALTERRYIFLSRSGFVQRAPLQAPSGPFPIVPPTCSGRQHCAGPGCPFPCNDHTVRSASVTGTTLCRTASVVSICRPTRPPLKQTVSPSAIVASANVGNCFFMPMGLQPPWI